MFSVHLRQVTFWPENSYGGSAGRVLEGDVGPGGGGEEGADDQDEKNSRHPICKQPSNW